MNFREALFSRLRFLRKPRLSDTLTPFAEALEELRRRQDDASLRARVEEYLNGDIPEHFQNEPILYLARHIATPNFETLRFLHIADAAEMQTVIGQDPKDIFVPQNQLKRSFGKLPVSLGLVKKDGEFQELYRHISVIDFNASNGKPLMDIDTVWGESLVGFHNRLFSLATPFPVTLVDDSAWIDRNCRGEILEHYKRFLALFLVHGILFEDYLLVDREEERFIREILIPAHSFVKKKFGVAPLITQLNPTTIESSKYWMSYPHQILAGIPVV